LRSVTRICSAGNPDGEQPAEHGDHAPGHGAVRDQLAGVRPPVEAAEADVT